MSLLDKFTKGSKKKSPTKGDKKSAGVRNEKEKDKKAGTKAKKLVARINSGAYKTIIHPTISEKATYLTADNKYVFEVYRNANKKQIRQAINDIYGIYPVKINIINISGKQRRYGKSLGKTKDRKKAVITLKKDQTIQVYEGV